MEERDPQTIIVEFVGPPGGGKTSLCNNLNTQLAQSGLKTAVFKDVKQSLYKKSFFNKLFFGLSNTIKNIPTYRAYVILLLRSGVFSFNSIYRYYKITLFDAFLRTFIRANQIQVLLLDQWSVQQLWSATIFRAKDYEMLKANLANFILEPKVMVYIDVDIDLSIASKRISRRSSRTSRFDKMSEDERKKYLYQYSDYLKALFQTSRTKNKLTISGSNDLATNVNELFIYLNTKLNSASTGNR